MKNQFSGFGKMYLFISLALVVVGLVMALVGGLNLGLNLSGGTAFTYDLKETAAASDVEKMVQTQGIRQARVLNLGETRVEILVGKMDADKATAFKTGLDAAMVAAYPQTDIENSQQLEVGRSYSKATVIKVIISVVVALVLFCGYMALRYQVAAGITAFAGAAQTLLLVLGVQGFIGGFISADSGFVAALFVAFIYYIVISSIIFDRIKTNHKSGEFIGQNQQAIAQSAAEQSKGKITIVTTAFALILVSFGVFGVKTIQGFAVLTLVGVVAAVLTAMVVTPQLWAILDGKLIKKPSKKA